MNLSSYDLVNVEQLTTAQNYAELGKSAGKVVIGAVNMIPPYTVSLTAEQTVAGYTFTTAGETLSSTSFFATVGSIVSALAIIGTAIAIVLTINSYLSSMWAVDSIKRQRDKVLTMFRRIKRLNRIADINGVIYDNLKMYLNSKYEMLNKYENELNDTNLEIRDFIPAKTNTYLLSNPIINFLQNEQNVLDIINQNSYKYIKVISFIDYEKDINILELDKVRIANADINTTKTYIDNLNATLVMIDKLEELKLYEQVIKDINYIKNNINYLLNEIKKTYIEQISTQDINNPLQMLIEITNDIPYLDLSAQTQDIGGLSLYPSEFIANDIPILFNKLNKQDIMILMFNNIYIEKFILLMINYYISENDTNLKEDIYKYIDSSINTYNLLNKIINLKIVKEKNYNQVLPDNINVDRYRIFTYLKRFFIKATKTFLENNPLSYKKSNNVNVSNVLILNDDIEHLDNYFYNKKYDLNDILYYFDFNTLDDNQRLSNIDLSSIKTDNIEEKYFSYIDNIRQELLTYGIDIINMSTQDIRNYLSTLNPSEQFKYYFKLMFSKTDKSKHINNFFDFIGYIYLVLAKIQEQINNAYEKCNYNSYSYSFTELNFTNNKLEKTKLTDTLRIKDCILVNDIIDEKISKLESDLYKIRQDYKYEYSVFGNLFLSEKSYFLFELFTKIEKITNSSVGLIKQTDLSVTYMNYTINFYEIMYEFFTKYINNYTGYIYSKNNYLKTLTDITQSNFVSVLQIACEFKPIEIKVEDLSKSVEDITVKKVSQTQLTEIIKLSEDIETADILANEEIKQPDIKQDNFGKTLATIIGVTLLYK